MICRLVLSSASSDPDPLAWLHARTYIPGFSHSFRSESELVGSRALRFLFK
jgi:hypothetical protein